VIRFVYCKYYDIPLSKDLFIQKPLSIKDQTKEIHKRIGSHQEKKKNMAIRTAEALKSIPLAAHITNVCSSPVSDCPPHKSLKLCVNAIE
jgi:hypothetical protein